MIVMNLDDNVDVSNIRKCIDYFLEKKDFDKAIHLYIRSGQYEEVIKRIIFNICIINYNIIFLYFKIIIFFYYIIYYNNFFFVFTNKYFYSYCHYY